MLLSELTGGFLFGTMNKDTIIVSMTTWPPREQCAVEAMRNLTQQEHSEPLHFVLVLSKEEWTMESSKHLLQEMQEMGVEVIWDDGNIISHKKLIPTLEKYPDSPILVVDDDMRYRAGFLQTIIDDHKAHPNDIIYGKSGSHIEIRRGKILDGLSQKGLFTYPGRVTYNEKPGSASILYPAHTFTDKRFFDRNLFMKLCPTCDETWQWAFCVMKVCTYRCMTDNNHPYTIGNPPKPLFHTNVTRCTGFHNAIAEMFPEYKIELKKRIDENPIKYNPKYDEL